MITMKAIIPPRFRRNLLDEEVRDAMTRSLNEIDAEWRKTFATWRDKPTLERREPRVESGALVGRSYMRHRIMYFISRGTRVRYATMTLGFVPKTRPRYIGSGQGRGGLLYVNVRRPRPGIKAREFEETIAKAYQKQLQRNLLNGLRRGAKKSGHGP